MLVFKGRPDGKMHAFTSYYIEQNYLYSYPQISTVLLRAKWADHHEITFAAMSIKHVYLYLLL